MSEKNHDTDDFDWLDSIIGEETDKRVKNDAPKNSTATDDDTESHWFDSIIDAAVEKRTKENEKILRKLKSEEKNNK